MTFKIFQGHQKWHQSKADFLLVVYSNVCRITHRFLRNSMWNSPMTLKYAQGYWQSYHLKAVRKKVKRKSPFSTTPLSFDAPLQRTPANICINLILPETTFPELHFCRWQYIWVALQVFEQFCPKAGDANPLVAEPETDFNAKWPFKVIYFGIIEEPLMGYVAQYNKCSLMWRFRRHSERKKRKSPFSTTPLSFDAPLQRTRISA